MLGCCSGVRFLSCSTWVKAKIARKSWLTGKKKSENYTAYRTPSFWECEPSSDFLLTTRPLHTHTRTRTRARARARAHTHTHTYIQVWEASGAILFLTSKLQRDSWSGKPICRKILCCSSVGSKYIQHACKYHTKSVTTWTWADQIHTANHQLLDLTNFPRLNSIYFV
jgi:hypothetical protein